jgi:hypothetical protein
MASALPCQSAGELTTFSSRHLHEDAGFSVDLVAGRRITGSLLNGAQYAKGAPSRPPAPVSQESVVAGARNKRLLDCQPCDL